MKERITYLKDQIKLKDPILYQKMIDFKVTDKEIFNMENQISIFLNQESDAYIHYLIDVKRDGTLIEYSKINSKDAKKDSNLKTIKSNYLTTFETDYFYEIDLFKDIKWNQNRQLLYEKISKIASDTDEKGYWLKGSFGVGKTYISVGFLNFAAKSNKKVAYLFTPELASSFMSNSQEGMTFLNKIENFKKADVLLIDDIGAEKVSEWFRNNILFTILNHREQNKKLTLFTSNLSIAEYHKKLNIKIVDQDKTASTRVIERIKSLTTEIELKGPNYRI